MTQPGFLARQTANPIDIDSSLFTPAFFQALQASCAHTLEVNQKHEVLADLEWQCFKEFCASVLEINDVAGLPQLFHHYLKPITFEEKAFVTGYFEPTLYGSRRKSQDFATPLYKLPENPKLFSRKEIREGSLNDQGLELIYVSCPIDAFFLEIQGSGRIILEDGSTMRVGYAGQNGRAYTAIGKIVKEQGLLAEVNYHTLKAFLKEKLSDKEYLDELYSLAHIVMDQNESYVFFKEILKNAPVEAGPIGTQGLSLTPMHSVACDPIFWPFGIPLLLNLEDKGLQKAVLTQDTGGAIKGHMRFDYFTGYGPAAESLAGYLKDEAQIVGFWPNGENL